MNHPWTHPSLRPQKLYRVIHPFTSTTYDPALGIHSALPDIQANFISDKTSSFLKRFLASITSHREQGLLKSAYISTFESREEAESWVLSAEDIFGRMIGEWGNDGSYGKDVGQGRNGYGISSEYKPKECCFLIEIDMLHPSMAKAVCWSVKLIMDKAERAVQLAEEKDRQRERIQIRVMAAKKQKQPPRSRKKKEKKGMKDEKKEGEGKSKIQSKTLNKKGPLVGGPRNSEWLILYHVPGAAIKVIKSSADIKRERDWQNDNYTLAHASGAALVDQAPPDYGAPDLYLKPLEWLSWHRCDCLYEEVCFHAGGYYHPLESRPRNPPVRQLF